MSRTNNEAQMQLSLDLKDLLIDLAIDDDDLSELEIEEIEESMDDLVGFIFEALKVKVTSVDGDNIVCEMTLLPDPE
jgi:hypothetical protein